MHAERADWSSRPLPRSPPAAGPPHRAHPVLAQAAQALLQEPGGRAPEAAAALPGEPCRRRRRALVLRPVGCSGQHHPRPASPASSPPCAAPLPLQELYIGLHDLLEFLHINKEGFRKTCKKHDKVTGGCTQPWGRARWHHVPHVEPCCCCILVLVSAMRCRQLLVSAGLPATYGLSSSTQSLPLPMANSRVTCAE